MKMKEYKEKYNEALENYLKTHKIRTTTKTALFTPNGTVKTSTTNMPTLSSLSTLSESEKSKTLEQISEIQNFLSQ